jgi:2'-hydroxyisoflavone reductase
MKLLIIGGTRFLGYHLVEAALARGHEITLFNRGKHSLPDAKNVETIVGDRKLDLSKLGVRRWDAVIDTCGYLPRVVKASAEFLSDSVERYVFISSLSVYDDVSVAGLDETAAVKTLSDEQLEQAYAIDSSGETSAVTYAKLYGGLKALCEKAAETAFPNRVLTIRPGLIVGPHDYTDRFTYWVDRVARGGEVLAPGRPDAYLQFVDVRDLAEWIVRMVEQEKTGIYNANCLPGTHTMENVLQECKVVSASDASFTWVSDDFLLQEQVTPWSEVPLWMPEETTHLKGFMFINCDKAIAAGLRFRTLVDTIQATLDWHKMTGRRGVVKAGLDSEKEQRLLDKWQTQ